VLVLENRCHSSLLFQPCACKSSWLRRARELAGFNPDSWRVAVFLGPHLYQVADAVIEALFSTTKIVCIGENPAVSGAIRSLAAAFYGRDTPCDYAVGPKPQRRGPRQSSLCARARRRPIISAAATPSARELFSPKRSFRCHRKKCASIVVSIWWCQPGYFRTS
jgi:hypothetical protein